MDYILDYVILLITLSSSGVGRVGKMSLISRLVKTPALSCSFRVDFGVAVVTSKLTKE